MLSKSKEAFRRVLLYQALLLIAVFFTLPFWLLAFVFVPKLRAGFWQKCGFISPALEEKLDKLNRNQPVLWIHAVSVGELLAVKPLIHLLLEQNITVVISTTTKTGQTLAQADLGNQCVVLYFPYDAFFAVNPLVKAIRPDLVMIMETELWPYFIWYVGHRNATALYLINGRLSDKSFLGYQKIKRFLRPILSLLDHAYMQTKLDAQRFKSLLLPHAINKVSVLGNLKFDLPPWHERQDKIQHLKKLFNFPKDSTVITVASTHEGEEALLLNVLYELGRDFPELRIVVVPRHPERIPQVSRLLREETFRFRLRSSLSESSLNTEKTVLVDSIGELKDILAFSDMAIVAGSFLPHLGGHNILEPIMVGTPVLYGPYMSNFKEIVYTVEQHEAGIQAQDALALKHAIVELMTNTSERERLVKAGYVMLAAHQGQTHSLVEAVLKQLHWHAV